MSTVVPFQPRASVEFEGAALERIAKISKSLLDLSEMINKIEMPELARKALQRKLGEVVEHFEALNEAITWLEADAPRLLRKMKPGQVRKFKTANANSTVEVTFEASARCNVIFVKTIQIGRSTVTMQVPGNDLAEQALPTKRMKRGSRYLRPN